jgi:hypothetical protein
MEMSVRVTVHPATSHPNNVDSVVTKVVEAKAPTAAAAVSCEQLSKKVSSSCLESYQVN